MYSCGFVDDLSSRIVEAAVTQNGLALRYASARCRSNRDVVAAAVENDPGALRYAAQELQDLEWT